MKMTTRSHTLIALMLALALLMAGCRSPEPTPDASLPGNGDTDPGSTASPSTFSIEEGETMSAIPDLSERQEMELRNLVWGTLYNSRIIPTDKYDHMAGLLLVSDRLFPGYIDDKLRNSSEGERFDQKVQPLLAHLDGLSSEEKENLVSATLRDYYLTSGEQGAVLVNLGPAFASASQDPSTGVTTLVIPIIQAEEVQIADQYHDLIIVKARELNLQTLMEEETSLPVLSAALEPSDTPIYNQQLRLELQGILLGWSEIRFEPGFFTDNSGDRLFARFFHTNGRSGADALMELRPLGVTDPDMFHPLLYGGLDAEPLPESSGSGLETAMEDNLRKALTLAVQDGSIPRERADELQDRFDDADLKAVAPSPVYRAAVLIAASVPEAGGNFILDMLLGENGTGRPLLCYFSDDPSLAELLAAEGGTVPDLSGKVGTIYIREDGSHVFILDQRFGNGREPAETIAALMPHEVIAHGNPGISLDEEVLGALVESLTWARLIERDPALLERRTALTLGRNSSLLMLLNSTYSDHTGSHVGILSQQAPPDWNIAPGSKMSFTSFKDVMQNFHYADAIHDPSSPGDKNIERLILAMFGDDPEIREEVIAESMGNTFSLYLDSHTQFPFTNERAAHLARLLRLRVFVQ